MKIGGKWYRTIWQEGKTVKAIDQTLLPYKFKILDLADHHATAKAITTMIIRGAGAIGAAGAYGMAQVALEAPDDSFWAYITEGAEYLRHTRPTAQNLFYAIDRVLQAMKTASDITIARQLAQEAAKGIADADAEACECIGRYGSNLIKDGMHMLTHCNAGWLAFVDWGSALSPVYMAKRQGKKVTVFVDETRPRCQGALLTAWELHQEGIEHFVIADNAAGFFMKKGDIDIVITGADRIAANGDVANKIGTYEKAVLAYENGIPFYIAAPTTTIDLNCTTGELIPIEERNDLEVLTAVGLTDNNEVIRIRIPHLEAKGRNPAFDVTPAKYITGIITESGIYKPGMIQFIDKK